ncbi:MAG TPA: aldo/keto reductase, partial [Opitutaceae bacterium]
MKYRPFGKHGTKVSEIGFGAWAIGGSWGEQNDSDSLAALNRALDLGCTFIDTAAGYGDGRSERLIGDVLRSRKASGKQESIFVATKTPPTEGNWPPSPFDSVADRYPEKYLRENIATRLKNLGVNKLDLLQLHTWTRAWNRDPAPFKILRQMQREGLLGLIGVSTPEHDQNAVIDLIRGGWIDSVQVIYNLFEQEPAAELLDTTKENGVGVIVRVAFDEGALTGKFNESTVFAKDDFRANYFAGDRLPRTLARVAEVQKDLGG